MDLAGPCAICSRVTRSLYSCWRCGAVVCENCHDRKTGLCMKCAGQVSRGQPKVVR